MLKIGKTNYKYEDNSSDNFFKECERSAQEEFDKIDKKQLEEFFT